MQRDNRERMERAVVGRLEDLQRAGVMQLPKRGFEPCAGEPTGLSRRDPPAGSLGDAALEAGMPKKSGWQPASPGALFHDEVGGASREVSSAPTLMVLQEHVAGCTRCDELARTRTQTVFGVGNPAARLCFLGEAPGADEDRLGEPFVGRAGQLLTKIIEACRMKREDVYILNMIKCRPPGNRNPLPQELANCRGYLERQFDLIRPEFICCLGAVAAQNLLGTTLSIGKLRGKVHAYRGAKVVCTYHPAFLLRSPAFKKETWEDMKLLMREMGVELQG
ncbi:MAG: uracil-DNA glycosylase [Pirellulales bacterium]